MTLDSPVTELKGVGEAVGKKFAVMGVKTVGDLIDYYPRRYEDYSVITPTSGLKPGPVTIEAVIKQAKGRYVRRGMHITEAFAVMIAAVSGWSGSTNPTARPPLSAGSRISYPASTS